MKNEANNLIYKNSYPNTNLHQDNMENNKLQSLTFPSLASSRLGELLNAKEREERLHINKNNNLSNKLNSLKKIFKFNIEVLTKYEIELNSYISKESNKNSVYSVISMCGYNESNGSRSALSSDSLFNTINNNMSKVNKSTNRNNSIFVQKDRESLNFVSMSNPINSNENFKKGLGVGKEISLPLELYPNVSCDLGKKGISSLNLDRVKKFINLFSRFSSEIATFQNIGYKFNSGQNHSIKNINSILESSFYPMFSLISKPKFDTSSNKVGVRIFSYLWPSKNKQILNRTEGSNMLTLYDEQLELLGDILIKIFNKAVDLEINRLYLPSSDSTIFSKILGRLSNSVRYKPILSRILRFAKFKNPTKIIRNPSSNTLAGKAEGRTIPAYLSGVKVKVAGRLLTQSVIPRRTVSIFQRGCLARGKSHFVNTARFTNKNKRGSYSITVSIGHVFV
jgi:hypothetical protein